MRKFAVHLGIVVGLAAATPGLALAESTSDLAARVAKLEQALSNRGLLDLLQEVENLKREVRQLRGQLENQTYAIGQLKKAQSAGYDELDGRLRGVEGVARQGPGAQAPLATNDTTALAPLATLQAAPTDAIAGAPAAQGNLQVQSAAARAGPGPGPGPLPTTDVDESGMPIMPSTMRGPEDQMPPDGAVDASEAPMPPGGQGSAFDAGGAPAARQGVPPAGQIPLPAAPGDNARPTVSSPESPLPPVALAAPTTDDAASEAAYRDAFGLLKSGEYDQAITAFEDFQARFPHSQYGDNAQFWLAEAHYVKRDFAAAIPAYEKMLSSYPASKKLSHAMLKIGYSYAELGQIDQARAVLEDLQARFPGTAAAQLAAQRITQLPASPPR